MAGIEIVDSNLPYSLDAEQAVLGAIIVDSGLISSVTDKLHPEHFHIQRHKDLFAVMSQMFITGQQMDIITIMEHSIRQGVFETQDEARAYLTKLAESTVTTASVESYAAIIEEKYMVRQLMLASKEIYDLATSGQEEPQALLDFAEKKIFDIRSDKEVKGLTLIRPILLDKIKELSALSDDPEGNKMAGLRSGFPSLDKYIFGLNKSDLILIAARPGMGKTSFAMNVATNVAKYYPQKRVCVFSLEMSKEQLVGRMLSSEARISSDQMRTGKISRNEWKSIGEATDVLSQVEMYIDDTANISVGEMKAKLRRMKNLGLVVIDYLQLMTTNRRDGNRVNEISEITRNLKIMAKELNVPVITLSQLSRGPEQRTDKRPMLSDLRESGSIEQDADIVLFLYRNSYYDKTDDRPNSCECIIAKNRHGETNTVGINWDGQFTRFTEADNVHSEH